MSDDEADLQDCDSKNRPIYWIKNRPERSQGFEHWIRKLDDVREETIRNHPSRQWRERTRRVPSQPINTTFTSFPEDMLLDYFSPTAFNALQPELRTRVSNGKIGLPLDIQDTFTRNSNEMLDDMQLMDKFRKEILQLYRLEDLDNNEVEEWLDDDEMDDISDDELEDDKLVDEKHSELALHLSMEDIQE
jgi:hypothetical protein